jgi:Flp pilus assembly protein TadD
MLQPFAAGGDAEVALALAEAARDPDPLLRLAAAQALESAPAAASLPILARLVADPLRAVRTQAAWVLSGLPREALSEEERGAFAAALDEYVAAQRTLADTGESHFNLGLLHSRRGRPSSAEESYRTALRLQPVFTPARMSLATLLAAQGRRDEAEAELRSALASHQALNADLSEQAWVGELSGEIHYSLALLLAESARLEEAAELLARAAALLPGRARVHYNRGLALQHLGRVEEAESALLTAEQLAPDDADVQNALAILYAQNGRQEEAVRHAERAVALSNGSPEARALLDRIRGPAPGP